MEAGIFPKSSKRIKSEEECKELWMSLFDVNVISSCSEKDSDLFCASALLKTAFYTFIKLKKRLKEAEKIIESQKLDLEVNTLENIKSKSQSLKSSGHVHCRPLQDVKQLPGRSLQFLANIQTTDNPIENKSEIHSRSSGDEIHCISKEREKLQSNEGAQQNRLETPIPKFVIPGIRPLDAVHLRNEDLDKVNIFCDRITIPDSKHLAPSSSKGMQEVCIIDERGFIERVQCNTPTKRKVDSRSSGDEIHSTSKDTEKLQSNKGAQQNRLETPTHSSSKGKHEEYIIDEHGFIEHVQCKTPTKRKADSESQNDSKNLAPSSSKGMQEVCIFDKDDFLERVQCKTPTKRKADSESQNDSKNVAPSSSKGMQEVCIIDEHGFIEHIQCKTPTKGKADSESLNVSPILKHFKKPRMSPAVIMEPKKSGKAVPSKSPSILPSEIQSVKIGASGCVDIKKEGCPSGSSNLERKVKISPDSLRIRKLLTTPAVSTSQDRNISNKKMEPNVAEGSQNSCPLSENEEDDIIMPSPVSSQSKQSPGGKEIATSPWRNENERGVYGRKRMAQKSFKERLMQTDSQVTFFLPMEEDKEDVLAEMEENVVISGEEECNVDEEMMEPIRLANSFDQLPSKNNSPPYRYQRAAVRKQSERRKLFGWECRDCHKYYEAAGLGPEEKKFYLNKCSRHRDKFSPQKNSPEGFWNPVFPDTPK